MPDLQKHKQSLYKMQEGLCGICWYLLQGDSDVDHILPKAWHDKLDKPGKNRKDNLQATHTACNKQKGSSPSPWHRHTLRMCLACIRGNRTNLDFVRGQLTGPIPAFRGQTMLQAPEKVLFASAYGLPVPYIHEYFNYQNRPVPATSRTDKFLGPFLEWLNTEPAQTRYFEERARMHAGTATMWNRAVKHVNRVPRPGSVDRQHNKRPQPNAGARVDQSPARLRTLLDDEALLGGVMACGIPADDRRRETLQKAAGEHGWLLSFAPSTAQETTTQQPHQTTSSGSLTVELVAHSCDSRKMLR